MTTLASPVRRILCATDFSECASVAVDWAAAFAEAEGAELHLVHAWQDPVVLSPEGLYVPIALGMAVDANAERELERTGTSYRIAGRHVVHDTPDVGVTSTATEIGADLVVVGTHGRSGLPHVLLGSVADRVIRTATQPVVIVPEAWKDRSRARPLVRRVLVPWDLTPKTEPAVVDALALAKRLDAEVDLLNVVELCPFFEPVIQELEHRARTDLMELVSRHAESASRAHLHVARGRAGDAILETAAARDVDLLILPTHARTGADRFLLGSVTERVARLAKRPLLTMRASCAAP